MTAPVCPRACAGSYSLRSSPPRLREPVWDWPSPRNSLRLSAAACGYSQWNRTAQGRNWHSMERILVIDDDPGFRDLLQTILAGEQYDVDTGASRADAIRLGSACQYDLVLSDLKLPDGSGLEILQWFTAQTPDTPVIMITAFGTLESAV